MFEGVLLLVIISAIWFGLFKCVCGTFRVGSCCGWCFWFVPRLLGGIGATYLVLLTFKFVLETLGFEVSEEIVWPIVDQPLPNVAPRRF
jgi:hypothetical protein